MDELKNCEEKNSIKEKMIHEYNLVSKQMSLIDLESEAGKERYHELRHYQNGIRFCLDLFK